MTILLAMTVVVTVVNCDYTYYYDEYPILPFNDENDPRLSQFLLTKRSAAPAAAPVFPQQISNQQITNTIKTMHPKILEAVLNLAASKSVDRGVDCPSSWPKSMCQQPSSFYIWMKELKQKEREREIANNAKEIIQKMILQSIIQKQMKAEANANDNNNNN